MAIHDSREDRGAGMRVAIVGSGYVGLVTAACLAERGHAVVCVDSDEAKVRTIAAGKAPFHEPGLDELLARHAGRGVTATLDLGAAVRASEITLIATGTPFDGHAIDLRYVTAAARGIGAALRDVGGYHVVAVKSTVVPGTTDGIVRTALETTSGKRAGRDFGVGMNPEFLSEGTALRDFRDPDRIVLGGMDTRTQDALAALYAGFEGVPTLRTNNATAELVKYASNALLATLISFSNEIANLCAETPGVDSSEVMRGVHAMRELTTRDLGGSTSTAALAAFLAPGCGFGGSCLPKDVKALAAFAESIGQATPLLDAVLRVNAERPGRVVALLEQELGAVARRRVAVLGLAFKPGTDDVRESPSLPVIEHLVARGAEVRAFDPVARVTATAALGSNAGVVVGSLAAAVDGADAVVLMTRWPEFEAVPARLRRVAFPPLLLDARRMIDPRTYGPYVGIGLARRGAPAPAQRGSLVGSEEQAE